MNSSRPISPSASNAAQAVLEKNGHQKDSLKRKYDHDEPEHFTKDEWLFGKNKFTSAKNVIPASLTEAFTKTDVSDPITDRTDYDRKKFSITCISSDGDPEFSARISLVKGEDIADVSVGNKAFVIELFKPSKGPYPFSKDELLKAIDFAKWDLITPHDNGSDNESI